MKKHLITTLIFASANLCAVADPAYSPASATPTTQTPPAAAMPEGLTGDLGHWMDQDTMTGNWGGARDTLKDAGFTITPVYEAEVFGAIGKGHDGVISDGLLNVALDVDLERVTHFWKDGLFHLNVEDIYGPSLSTYHVGDFSNTSNLAGYNTFRLQEMWLQQTFLDQMASLRAGVLAADTEFFTSQASSLFINGTLGAFNLLVLNFPDAPAYPIAVPGIRFDIAPVSMLDFKAAIFWPNANNDPDGNNNHGTDFSIRGEDGPLLAFEGTYKLNQSPNARGLVGSYKAGAFIQHGDYTTWESQAAFALGTGSLSRHGTNYAVYFVADQELYKKDVYDIEAFIRAGFAPSRYSFIENYFDAGLNFTGFVPGRDSDIAGIAVARSGVSDDFSDAQGLLGNSGSSSETVIEATYKVSLSKWASLQPDLQYIINPSGVRGSENAFVLGARVTLAF